MIRRNRIYINPKFAFVTLSITLGLALVWLLPALYKVLMTEPAEYFDYSVLMPDQPFLDGILGILAGIAFSFFGLFRLDITRLVQITRLMLTLMLMVVFLMYITVKSLI